MNLFSFSLYGSAPRYWQGAIANAVIAAELFPDWICRFYVDRHNTTTEALHRMENCQVRAKPPVKEGCAMLWRFAAASGGDVDYVCFRDADSRLSQRERRAIQDWQNSACEYHIIRDHPQHFHPAIRGGLWGVNGGYKDMELWIDQFIEQANPAPRGLDELFLQRYIAPLLTTVCYHQRPEQFTTYPNDTVDFIGQSFDEGGKKLC